ncbi:hypothetical protein LCGC14_0175220 [marine sediment metagenome]|uniref:Uncharacterized protein n=1 Tax=marine sediment metagenome TaxID=412755 RepID=A0A0F9XTP1_9ZZZZ
MPLTEEQKKLFARKDYEVWKRASDHSEDIEMVFETDDELEAYKQATVKNYTMDIKDRTSFFYNVKIVKVDKLHHAYKAQDKLYQLWAEDAKKNSE